MNRGTARETSSDGDEGKRRSKWPGPQQIIDGKAPPKPSQSRMNGTREYSLSNETKNAPGLSLYPKQGIVVNIQFLIPSMTVGSLSSSLPHKRHPRPPPHRERLPYRTCPARMHLTTLEANADAKQKPSHWHHQTMLDTTDNLRRRYNRNPNFSLLDAT